MPRAQFDENLAAQFIFESNLIEDVEVSLDNLKESIRLHKPRGHTGALLYLENYLSTNVYWNKAILCQIHKLIMQEQNGLYEEMGIPRDQIGCYRSVPVFIGGEQGVAPHLIEEDMSMLIDQIKNFQRKIDRDSKRLTVRTINNPIETISDFHFEYEGIHPFIDGSGRTGRLLVWYLMRFAGLTPFIFTSRDRGYTYYEAFRSKTAMREYFRTRYQLPQKSQ